MPPPGPSFTSPFAPPRAGHAAGLWRAWFTLRRRGRLGDLRVPPAIANLKNVEIPWPFFGVVVVPTLGIHLLPDPLWRRVGLALFWIALVFATTEYARPAGAAAFGLAAALHGIGAAAHRERHAPVPGYARRLVRRLAIVCSAALIFTLVASHLASRRVIAVAGQTGPVLVDRAAAGSPPRVGESIAYRIHERYDAGVRILGGVYFGRVLATGPGHTVAFAGDHYQIDGLRFALLPNMPRTGAYDLDATHAFVWPETFHFRAAPRELPGHIGVVDHSALVGRPYKRWFWHTQSP